jgi:predicted pyridoxine 5'-phosphate oxidase superfamily flavin-nucleotide-binding protein
MGARGRAIMSSGDQLGSGQNEGVSLAAPPHPKRRGRAGMSRIYQPEHRALQRRFDTERLADRLEEVTWHDHLTAADRAFVEARDMFFLATADAEGRPNCSYKGGDPGFVRVLDERTLVFPCYDGNGMFLSLGNAAMNPHVGMLFVDFESPRRLRVNGEAATAPVEAVPVDYPEAQLVVLVRVREVFPNCPRYVHRYQLVERSRFVPHADAATPVPDWKRSDWARDVLPRADPARRPGE